ncbi:MAG TPA: carboxypeptidase-like regulatory domain-containing protein [Pyrinomonadaceae bacterium]|nr:carboxypeptidase-like regulatory domain-containing protein [Pyrinomonadaceae bacterium]
MSTSTHRIFSLTLFLAFLFTCCFTGQSQTTATSKSSPNTIKGTVSLKGKGVAGIVVNAIPKNGVEQRRPQYRGVTDHEGKYTITNIPSGTFQFTPELLDYASADQSGQTLLLTEGETIEDVDFELTRGSVITGRVTAAGKPLIEQNVIVQRIDNSMLRSIRTDDRGVYRAFGLKAGKYNIYVGKPQTFMGQSSRFNQTFYPATTDLEKAQTIDLAEGAEVKDIDIKVELNEEATDRYSVSGTIVEAGNGRPVSGMRLRLQRTDARGFQPLNIVAISDKEGRFKFDEISPGNYTVMIAALSNTVLRTESAAFTVTDGDVTDVAVKAVRRASIFGVLVFEGVRNKLALPPLGSLFVNGYVVREGSSEGRFGESARVGADGSFHMTGLSDGVVTFSLGSTVGPMAQGLSIARVELNGIVQARGLEIKGDESIIGVRLVLKFLSGVIRGAIKATNGDFPPGTHFSAVLRNPSTDSPGPLKPAIVDSRGRFFIDGLADGTYEIVVYVTVFGPNTPRKSFTAKQPATILDGNVTDVVVTVDLSETP